MLRAVTTTHSKQKPVFKWLNEYEMERERLRGRETEIEREIAREGEREREKREKETPAFCCKKSHKCNVCSVH